VRILITGATGFIGRNVVDYLVLQNKHELITTGTKSKKEVETLFPALKNTTYIQKNLNEKEENYFSFFNNPDKVIHLSWEGLPNYNELFHIERNLPANFYFVKNMIEHGLKDITVAGTCFEYGLQEGCLNEEMPAKPATVYGQAKDTLRKFIEALQNTHKFSFKWLRLFYLFGAGQGEKSLLTQMTNAIIRKDKEFNMSKGEQIRDFLPVETMAEYIALAALQNKIDGTINCCSEKPVSVRSFVESFFEQHNYPIKLNLGYYPYPEYEPFAFWGDAEKLEKMLNYARNLNGI